MSRYAFVGCVGFLLLLGLMISVPQTLAEANAPDHEMQKARTLADRVRACVDCHPSGKDKAKLVDPARTCDANCLRCHKDMDKHHPVGPEVEAKDKVLLPLLGTNKVACISCHDLKTSSSDTRSWKAQSLFARLFQGQQRYRTYYLRINNRNGELCKACH
jgi:hypothetical protein